MAVPSDKPEDSMSPVKSDAGGNTSTAEEEPGPDFIDNRVYVSNIPFSYTSVDLEKIFSKFGTVLAAQVVSNERGSKGFGFVTLDTADGCARARLELDGASMGGRKIEVKKARQMQHSRFQTNLAPAPTRALPHARSLLSPSLTSSYMNDMKQMHPMNYGGMGVDISQQSLFSSLQAANPALANVAHSNAASFLVQLQMAQSLQTAQYINAIAAAQQGAGLLGQNALLQQQLQMINPLLNPVGTANPLTLAALGLDMSSLLRQQQPSPTQFNAAANATLLNALDPSSYSGMDALSAAAFLAGGGGPVMSLPAPPSLAFDRSSSSVHRRRPAPPSPTGPPTKHARIL